MKLFPERIKLALGKRMTDFSLKFSLTKLKKIMSSFRLLLYFQTYTE